MAQTIDLIIKIFNNTGIELIGSLLLATTIGLFYTKSNIKWGLKYLSLAFYTLVFKNLILMGFNLYEVLNPGYQVPIPLYDWIDFSFICIASALFLASALSMLHLLFSPLPFSITISSLLFVSGYIVSTTPKTTDLFTILPNIYIASAFLIIGLSLIMMQKAQKNALRAIGLGFTLLGLYYIQSVFHLSGDTWFYQATIYLIVLVLSLSTQISLMKVYCTTLENNLLAEKARRDLILDASPFPILITRLIDDSVLYINPVAVKLFNLEQHEITTFKFSDYFADPVKRVELLSRIKRETVIHSFEVQMKNPKTMEAIWFDLSTRIIDLDGELALYTTFKDMTETKQKEEELFTQASTDPLTGLFNRRQFELMANTQVSLAKRHKTSYCILMLDIDHFKKVNDTYGHDAGDEVLKYISLVLKTSLRESDILARYGGEEFILFLPHTSPTEGWHVAERLRTSVEQSSIFSNEKALKVTISLGLSNSLEANLQQAIKEADTALYESKTTGRNKTTLYTPNMKDYHKPEKQKTKDEPQEEIQSETSNKE
ncbi:MAG: diguanylate cyclase [Alphaproteobacteria bacterium]|nr:diguanylate cyclase [Alphaproteobacteria bacterium]